jgi:flagellar basal-body rod modification protein FlgD
MDKDAFMKLMLTQMKNQDPTNPMQSHEMAAQLAQFTSLEQLQNVNTTLTDMKNAQAPTQSYQALNFIGKGVSGDSAKVFHADTDKAHDFRFTLPQDGAEVTIKVNDADGTTLRTYNLRDLKKGENKITWNAEDERGIRARTGDYQFVVEAKNAAGGKLAVTTAFEGTISGVNYTNEGPILLIGNQSIRLSDVKKIVNPSAPGTQQNDQNVKDVTALDLKKEDQKVENKIDSSQLEKNVALSRGMMDKLHQVNDGAPNKAEAPRAMTAKVTPETKPKPERMKQ